MAGDDVSVNNIGGASVVEVKGDRQLTFNNFDGQSYGVELNGGAVQFTADEIRQLDGTVTGDFTSKQSNGSTVESMTHDEVGVVGDGEDVTEIVGLTDGAKIVAAEGELTATTDSEGTFTDASGNIITVAGDDEVVFNIVDGEIVGVEGVDDATITGALNILSNQQARSRAESTTDDPPSVWWRRAVAIIDLSDGADVIIDGGAGEAVTDGDNGPPLHIFSAI